MSIWLICAQPTSLDGASRGSGGEGTRPQKPCARYCSTVHEQISLIHTDITRTILTDKANGSCQVGYLSSSCRNAHCKDYNSANRMNALT
jgi:hypothetical protein